MSKKNYEDDFTASPDDVKEALEVFMNYYGLLPDKKKKAKAKKQSNVISLQEYKNRRKNK